MAEGHIMEIVEFKPNPKEEDDLTADKVLEECKGKLDHLLVIGWDEDDMMYVNHNLTFSS